MIMIKKKEGRKWKTQIRINHIASIFRYRVFIKYCVFPPNVVIFSELSKFCCSAGV